VGAQKRRKGVERIQRGQREQKQEHASAERSDRIAAVLGFSSHAAPPVCLTEYNSGQTPAMGRGTADPLRLRSRQALHYATRISC
jgi:hypothetical protein